MDRNGDRCCRKGADQPAQAMGLTSPNRSGRTCGICEDQQGDMHSVGKATVEKIRQSLIY